MAIPAPVGGLGSYSMTSRTEGQYVDKIVHEMMCAKSRLIDRIAVGPACDEPRIEWVYAQTNPRTVTATTGTTLNGSGSNAALGLAAADAKLCPIGTILRNVSRATPLGGTVTLGDELLQVTANPYTNGASAIQTTTVFRDYGNLNSGTGSTIHANTDTFEIVYTPQQEGSQAEFNVYKVTGIAENYTSILSVEVDITGTQMQRRMAATGDDAGRQYTDRMTELKNKVAAMIIYGAPNPTTAAGTVAQIRSAKGVAQYMCAAGGNVDYNTTTISESAVSALFETIFNNGGDENDPYILVCNPKRAREISTWGADKVRTTWDEKRVGRQITTYVSDLGFQCEIVPEVTCGKGQAFILNTTKVELVPFRPWSKMLWGLGTGAPNGDDAQHMRVIGEYTVKVIDPLKAHGVLSQLNW